MTRQGGSNSSVKRADLNDEMTWIVYCIKLSFRVDSACPRGLLNRFVHQKK
ncbi:MAG: hypothetical protein HXO03_00075 [Prevotella salivae]|jgi:hypothetical protein|nr:hypothetical protein [Segatella salivae]